MIPTREQINAKELWTGGQALGGQALGWLLAMRDEIDRLQADLDRANTEAALARDAMAKATTPAPDREAAIRAWKEEALSVLSGEEDFEGYLLLRRSEITKAVALMRSAGDGKALLRELRAWIIDEKWCAPGIVRKIDEMLAQPAPVEQPAPPAAAVPDDTRELVAQLADVAAEFFVAPWCDRAKAIAAKLRGGA